MLRPAPEEQILPDHNLQLIQQEAQVIETRLRRKMVVKPKGRVALAPLTRSHLILRAGGTAKGK
jgi:hypothetical protein